MLERMGDPGQVDHHIISLDDPSGSLAVQEIDLMKD
jgi:hypothetical protein